MSVTKLECCTRFT